MTCDSKGPATSLGTDRLAAPRSPASPCKDAAG